jgi:predicted DNA-binding transcriptional regulator AlpA
MITLDISPVPSGRRARALASRSVFVSEQRAWVPATELAAELGVCRRTLTRWLCDTALEFPRPKIVNHRLYFDRGAVEAWKAKKAEAR